MTEEFLRVSLYQQPYSLVRFSSDMGRRAIPLRQLSLLFDLVLVKIVYFSYATCITLMHTRTLSEFRNNILRQKTRMMLLYWVAKKFDDMHSGILIFQ